MRHRMTAGLRIEALEGRMLLSGDFWHPSDPTADFALAHVSALGGQARAIAVSGSTAFIAEGFGGLAVVDVSNPAAPQFQTTWLPPDAPYSLVDNVEVVAGHAFVSYTQSHAGTVAILDVSSPGTPAVLSTWHLSGQLYSTQVLGNTMYLAWTNPANAQDSGLQIVDITSPAAPVLLGAYVHAGTFAAAVANGYAYLASGMDPAAIEIVDIRDAAHPVHASAYATQGTPSKLSLAGNHLYFVDSAQPARLNQLDLADPAHPAFAGAYQASQSLGEITARAARADRAAGGAGDAVFVSSYDANSKPVLLSIDLSDPSAPVAGDPLALPDYGARLATSGDYLYIPCQGSGVVIVNAADPASLTIAGVYQPPCQLNALVTSGSTLYAADANGLASIDLSHPGSPRVIGRPNTPVHPAGQDPLAVSGNFAYLITDTGHLQVIDLSNPAAPVIRGEYIGTAPNAVAAGQYAYLGDGSDLIIIDASDPDHPTAVGSIPLGGRVLDVTVVGSLAYVAHDGGTKPAGISVVWVDDPANPGISRDFGTPGRLLASGHYLYDLDTSGTLQIFDIRSPNFPELVGSLAINAYLGLAVSGNYLFAAGGDHDLQVVDLSSPALPALVGSYDIPVGVSAVAIQDGYLYLTPNSAGLETIRILQDNLAPTDLQVTDTVIPEAQPIGTVVAELSATDPNAGETFTYSLADNPILGPLDNASFTIRGNQLLTAVTFDYETQREYHICLRVMDSGGLTYDGWYTIYVTGLVKFGLQPGEGGKPRLGTTMAYGDSVTFSLTGGGRGILQADNRLVLTGTTANSVLTISVKKPNPRYSSGDGIFELNGITSDGPLKRIFTPAVILGGTTQINTAHQAPGKATLSFRVNQLRDASIEVNDLPLASFSALSWQDTDTTADQLIAPAIGKLAIPGRRENLRTYATEYLPGDLPADLQSDAAIGSISVAGTLSGTIRAGADGHGISIASLRAGQAEGMDLRTAGSVKRFYLQGTMRASRLQTLGDLPSASMVSLSGSEILVGVVTSIDDAFATTADAFANPAAKLGKLTLRGSKVAKGQTAPAYMADSHISAANYGKLSLVNVAATTPQEPILHVLNDTGTLTIRQLSPGMVPGGTWKPTAPAHSAHPELVQDL